MADSPGDGGGTGADGGSSVATADAPARQSSDQPTPVIDSGDGQERGDAKPPSRPLDSDNGRKAEAREPAQPVRPDLGRKSDLPPKSVTDASGQQPQDWREGESVELQTDQSPDVTAPQAESPVRESPEVEAARSDVKEALDKGERIQEARDEVDAAFDQANADGFAPNTTEQFEADFQKQMDEAPTNPDVKQVEFKEPGPAKEVEFQGASDRPSGDDQGGHDDASDQDEIAGQEDDATRADQSGLSAERVVEAHSPEQQRVVDDAKAELARREAQGEAISSDAVERTELWNEQGKNDLGYKNDCALATTSEVLRDCGVERSESEIVDQAVDKGICTTWHESPAKNGGVDGGAQIAQLLKDNGVDARVVNPETPEDLATWVEQGHGVIAEVNAGELWDGRWESDAYEYNDLDQAKVNHVVQVTGTTRDSNGELTGFIVNDTGAPDGAGTVVPIETWNNCWTNTDRDHETVVTTLPTSAERMGR